jgi:hypothetical protein
LSTSPAKERHHEDLISFQCPPTYGSKYYYIRPA